MIFFYPGKPLGIKIRQGAGQEDQTKKRLADSMSF